MKLTPILLALAVLSSGCIGIFDSDAKTLADTSFAIPTTEGPISWDNITWPNLNGTTLTILDHGAFTAFEDAATDFQRLTGAKVVQISEDDTGSALSRATREVGNPSADVLYGIDNALFTKARDAGIFTPYKPQLASRISAENIFFGDDEWVATPVDFGYIAINIDEDNLPENTTIQTLLDLRDNGATFVTQDPRFSTPGLGFLLITIDYFGENTPYNWREYWKDLLEDVTVTDGWSEAYEGHFSGGYGRYYGSASHAIVTSYTESPAYEAYFGEEDIATVLLDSPAGKPQVFKQIQTMGILHGTKNLVAAQAWIEFTLTQEFQEYAAPQNGVYPVDSMVSTDPVYGDVDPVEGIDFHVIDLDYETIGENLNGWISQWVALFEKSRV